MKWHVIFEPQNLELYATGILTTLGLLFSSLGIGAVLALLFALALTVMLAAAVADAVLCGFATRRAPGRFPMLLILHGVIVVATTQVLPPALPLVWLGCAFTAWRQGNR